MSGNVACPECAGDGWVIGMGCCGNFTRHGECRGHCVIQVQEQCQFCGGHGELPADWDCDSGSGPKGENSRSEVEGEAPQSGGDSRIAQTPPPRTP